MWLLVVGWFMRLQDLGRTTQPFSRIHEVAEAQIHSFISRTPITGYKHEALKNDPSNFVYTPFQIKPGQLFTVADVYRQYNSRPKSICCWNWIQAERKQIKDPQSSTYLRCVSELRSVFFFLFSEEGDFFPATRPGIATSNNENAVYRLLDLTSGFHFPLDVKLVYGMPPSSHCSFTGNLRLEEAYKQESVIASTLSMSNPRFIEFPSDTETRVLLASRKQKYMNYDIYKNTLDYCQKHIELYSKSIKVTQSFSPGEDGEVERGRWQHTDEVSFFTGSEYSEDESEEASMTGEDEKNLNNKVRRRSSSKSAEQVSATYEIIPLSMQRKRIEKMNTPERPVTTANPSRQNTENEHHIIKQSVPLNNIDDSARKSGINKVPNLERNSAGKITISYGSPKSEPIDQFLNQLFDYKTLSRIPNEKEKAMAANFDLNNIQPIPPPPTDVNHNHVTLSDDKDLEIPIAPPPPPLQRLNYEESNQDLTSGTKHGMFLYENEFVEQPKSRTLALPTIQTENSAFSMYSKPNITTNKQACIVSEEFSEENQESHALKAEHQKQPSNLYCDSKIFGHPAIPVNLPIIGNDANITGNNNGHFGSLRREIKSTVITLDSTTEKEMDFLNSPNDSGVYSDRRYSDIESVSMQGSTVESLLSPVETPWYPPVDTRSMSVSEVCDSLRFICIKEPVVQHFSNEQIDGVQLMELDEGLLKEAFTDMNGLERKKVLDFQRGWRPKKR